VAPGSSPAFSCTPLASIGSPWPRRRRADVVPVARRRYAPVDCRSHDRHRRVARILALLLQAAETASQYADYLSPIQRLWKYVALGLTSIILEEANPIFGGIAARNGRLGLTGVITAVAVGTWIASIALYFIGRWRIEWVRRRWPKKQNLLDSALALVQRNPWSASLAVRFAYGLRIPVPIACGAAPVSLPVYVVASGISCWVWSGLFVFLGWKAGGAALAMLGFTTRLEVRLGFLLIVLIAALFLMRRRRRIAERTVDVLSRHELRLEKEKNGR
jgi:membrane protein DedA with SNARE-associated domain